jgi:hypothetical protein
LRADKLVPITVVDAKSAAAAEGQPGSSTFAKTTADKPILAKTPKQSS